MRVSKIGTTLVLPKNATSPEWRAHEPARATRAMAELCETNLFMILRCQHPEIHQPQKCNTREEIRDDPITRKTPTIAEVIARPKSQYATTKVMHRELDVIGRNATPLTNDQDAKEPDHSRKTMRRIKKICLARTAAPHALRQSARYVRARST